MNIIEDMVTGKIREMDRQVKEGKHDKTFYKREIYIAVWNSRKLKKQQQNWVANQGKGWPDVDAYSDYVYKVITKAIGHQREYKIGDRYYHLPEFPSFPIAGQRERLYCRLGHLTLDELRATGRAYLRLGIQNTTKGKIMLAAADEAESRGLQAATDDLVKQVVATLANKGEI